MKIGTNIKKRRVAQGLTQEQLAEKLYVTRQTVSSWERAASNPDLEQLEAIAGALETDVTGLLYGPQPRHRPSRRQVAGTVGLALLVLVLWAACWKIGPWSNGTMKNYGVLYPHMIYYYYQILVSTLAGAAVLAVARLRWNLVLEGRSRKLCLGIGLALLVLVLSYGPLVGLSVCWGSFVPLWLNRAFGILFLLLWKGMFKAVSVLAGLLLCLAWCQPSQKGEERP